MLLQRKQSIITKHTGVLTRKPRQLYTSPFLFFSNIKPELFVQNYYPWLKAVECFDVETTGLNPYQDGGTKIFSYSTFDRTTPVVQRFDRGHPKYARERLQAFLDDVTVAKTCHNVKFEISQLKTNGYHIPEKTVWHDTMLMSQLLDNLGAGHSLDYLCWKLCGWSRELDIAVKRQFKETGCYSLIDEVLMHEYQIADAMRGMLLYDLFAPEIMQDKKLTEVYLFEVELAKETQGMEQTGMLVNEEGAIRLIEELSDDIDKMQKQTYEMFGEYINPNSDARVRHIMYEVLGYPVIARNDKTGSAKVDKFTIFELQEEYGADHPFLDLVLKYRTYTTARTNITKYLRLRDSKGVIHCNIKTNHDKTGREAAEKPNLQNIAKNLKTPTNPYPVAARQCFMCRPGWYMDLVDYAGIELRLIIALCGEEELIDAVRRGADVHSMVCNYWYHDVHLDNTIVRFSELDGEDPLRKSLRRIGKNGNFALGYGASNKKLSKTLGISVAEVKRNRALIEERWPKYAFFTKNMLRQVQERGFVETPFGRRLKVATDKVFSGSNYIIQGTAAEILKRSQVRVARYYHENWGDLVKILVPVHDEIIQEKHESLQRYDSIILPQVRSILIDFPEIPLPLDVEYKRSYTTWDAAKEITLAGKYAKAA